jgi:hypothetical protein
MRLGRKRPRPDDLFNLEDVAFMTGLSLDVVTREAEWRAIESGEKVMTRKQCQAFWLRMTQAARAAGEPPGMKLDLSILVFADDAIFASGGGHYRRNWRRFWRGFREPYLITGSEDGSTCLPGAR